MQQLRSEPVATCKVVVVRTKVKTNNCAHDDRQRRDLMWYAISAVPEHKRARVALATMAELARLRIELLVRRDNNLKEQLRQLSAKLQ